MHMTGLLSGLLGTIGTGAPFLAQAGDATTWLPEQAAAQAGKVDDLFYLIFWFGLFFFTLLASVTVLFAVRFRRRQEGETVEPSPKSDAKVQALWLVVPALVVAGLFTLGFRIHMDQAVAPSDAYEIQVVGQPDAASFTYPGGMTNTKLHVPVERAVKLSLTGEGAVRSFSIPAFRVKRDMVPGQTSEAWFTPNAPGEFDLYLSDTHALTTDTVFVHTAEAFAQWISENSDVLGDGTLEEGGQRVYDRLGCKQCHSLDGSPGVAPSFKDLYGTMRSFKTAEAVMADEEYIRESLMTPTARVSAGFEPVMPSFQGRIQDRELEALTAFLKSLSVHTPQEDGEAAIEESGAEDAAAADETGVEAP